MIDLIFASDVNFDFDKYFCPSPLTWLPFALIGVEMGMKTALRHIGMLIIFAYLSPKKYLPLS